MHTAAATVLDASSTLPPPPRHLVTRTNLLDAVDRLFADTYEVVVLEGEEGCGKTVLASQFARRHPDRTLSLFVRPSSRLAYDPGILRDDLCNQIHYLVRGKEMDDRAATDDATVARLMRALQRSARKGREPVFFVVDGLFDIPEHDAHLRDDILRMLPVGFRGTRFLLTVQKESLLRNIAHLNPKVLPVPLFSPEETLTYLEDLGLSRSHISELHRACRGAPGHLASIRRILESGESIDQLIAQLPSKLPHLFDIEWSRAVGSNPVQRTAIGVLAHDLRAHTSDSLARICGATADAIAEAMRPVTFITAMGASGVLAFESDAFRSVAIRKLTDITNDVIALIINDLYAAPMSKDALAHLPIHLRTQGRLAELVTYLSDTFFMASLDSAESFVSLMQTVGYGVEAAKDLGRLSDLLRLAVSRSCFTAIRGAHTWGPEVAARVAVRDYSSALALARNVSFKEDQLHLLAILARQQKEQGLPIPPELADEIGLLVKQIDVAALGQRAIMIACDLIFSQPQLAIRIVEQVKSRVTSPSRRELLDATMSLVSLAAYAAGDAPGALEPVCTNISDPDIRRFFLSAEVSLRSLSGSEVLAEADRVSGVGDKLHLLRCWTSRHRRRPDAYAVMRRGLELAIQSVEYIPNARDVQQLVAPLQYLAAEEEAREIVRVLDAQRAVLEARGPTVEYIRILLLMIAAELKYDVKAAETRAVDVYLQICEVSNVWTRAECLAHVVAMLASHDPARALEAKDGLHSSADADLRACIGQLLESSADHYTVFRPIVRALAGARFDLGAEVAKQLNTRGRRDAAILDVIDAGVRPHSSENVDHALALADQIAGLEKRSEAIQLILSRLDEGVLQPAAAGEKALRGWEKVLSIHRAGERCQAWATVYRVLMRSGVEAHAVRAAAAFGQMELAWRQMDDDWAKISRGFSVVPLVAAGSVDDARKWLETVAGLRDQLMLRDDTAAVNYVACLRLAMMAYSGLVSAHRQSEGDEARVAELIRAVGSERDRVGLWCDLALTMRSLDNTDECRRIVEAEVRPTIDRCQNGDCGRWVDLIVESAPALYCAHTVTTMELLAALPDDRRDEAIAFICRYLLTKTLPSQPFVVQHHQVYRASFNEMVDCMSLLDAAGRDGLIYCYIECIADTIVYSRRPTCTKDQKADIAGRLIRIAETRFPCPGFIPHQGYRILAKGQAARLHGWDGKEWNRIREEARRIPNIADRALVLALLAEMMPPGTPQAGIMAKDMLAEAKNVSAAIPAVYDRIDRLLGVAKHAKRVDTAMFRDAIRTAFQLTMTGDTETTGGLRRAIVDVAYQQSPELAAELIAGAERDPARVSSAKELREEVRGHELGKAMANGSGPGADRDDRQRYPGVAWNSLGLLNAGRVQAHRPVAVQGYLEIASLLPMSEAFPIVAWFVGNVVARYSGTAEVDTVVRPVFEALVAVCKVAAHMAERRVIRDGAGCKVKEDGMLAPFIMVGVGERVKGMEYLREWIGGMAREHLKICDQYFGPEDMEVLQLVLSENPGLHVKILTGWKQQRAVQAGQDISRSYEDGWLRLSSQDPPRTDIVVVEAGDDKDLPIHDRWWVTCGGGLTLGTSLNSLGVKKASKIEVMGESQAGVVEDAMDEYLELRKREHSGMRVKYHVVTL